MKIRTLEVRLEIIAYFRRTFVTNFLDPSELNFSDDEENGYTNKLHYGKQKYTANLEARLQPRVASPKPQSVSSANTSIISDATSNASTSDFEPPDTTKPTRTKSVADLRSMFNKSKNT